MKAETRRIIEAVLRSPGFLLAWIMFLSIKIPTIILGLVVVPVLWKWRRVDYDKLPSYSRPWSNPGDWHGGPFTYENSLPKWWVTEQLPVYARWWHPIANALNVFEVWRVFESTGTKNRGAGVWSFYKYHAIRNPANGLRSFEILDLDIDRDRVRYVSTDLIERLEPAHMRKISGMKTSAYICWQGWQAGVKVVHLWSDDRHFVFKFGWRVQPSDAHHDRGFDLHREDAGFATKLLPYRKG